MLLGISCDNVAELRVVGNTNVPYSLITRAKTVALNHVEGPGPIVLMASKTLLSTQGKLDPKGYAPSLHAQISLRCRRAREPSQPNTAHRLPDTRSLERGMCKPPRQYLQPPGTSITKEPSLRERYPTPNNRLRKQC